MTDCNYKCDCLEMCENFFTKKSLGSEFLRYFLKHCDVTFQEFWGHYFHGAFVDLKNKSLYFIVRKSNFRFLRKDIIKSDKKKIRGNFKICYQSHNNNIAIPKEIVDKTSQPITSIIDIRVPLKKQNGFISIDSLSNWFLGKPSIYLLFISILSGKC